MTVSELRQRMTVREFEDWKALSRVEAAEREAAERKAKRGRR
jgi:hypothetical protein